MDDESLQCDVMAKLLLKIWPFTARESVPNSIKSLRKYIRTFVPH